jgi:dihydrofolate reductase
MKHFRKLTENNFCVFGRKTFESIGHPLPNRHNIILTKNEKYEEPAGTYVYSSLEDVIHEYHSYNNDENELFICGGSEIYKQALKYADRIYLTIIEHRFSKIDTYFTPFSFLDWKVTSNVKNLADETHPYNYSFVTYERRELIKSNLTKE